MGALLWLKFVYCILDKINERGCYCSIFDVWVSTYCNTYMFCLSFTLSSVPGVRVGRGSSDSGRLISVIHGNFRIEFTSSRDLIC